MLIFERKIFGRLYDPRRDEQMRKYSEMEERAKDQMVRSPGGNGGG